MLIVNNQTIATDTQGFLRNLKDWNESVAIEISKLENIELTAAHWEIINFIRDYYQEYRQAPAMRILIKAVKQKFGEDKGNSIYLHSLFPGGAAKLISKIAGLPKPTRCI